MKRTLVLGGPGTGKTRRLLGVMESALDRGVHPGRVAFVSFTKAAVNEARARACERFGLQPRDLPYFRTLHSLAFRELGLQRHDIVGEEHLSEIATTTGELFTGDGTTEGPAAGRNADPLLTLDHYARTTMTSLRDAWQDHGGEIEWFRLKRFSDSYRAYKREREVMDFTDLLSAYVDSPLPAVDVDLAVVDEVQDLTLLQHAVVDKGFSRVKELWWAGDDDQCHPAGTMVETTCGEVPIEHLKPWHFLYTFARRDGQLYRNGTFKKSRAIYTGDIYVVRGQGRRVEATANHRWLVKWTEAAKSSKLNAVYLMKRGDWWRVGWTQLFSSDKTFHLNHRTNHARADAAWMLKTFTDKREAYAYEQYVNARYGIPMLPFHQEDSGYISAELIKQIFTAVDSKKGALQALYDHHLLPEHPFINRLKPTYSRYGSTINEVVSCNLLSDLMMVPIHDGGKCYSWHPLQVSHYPVKSLPVYSLEVNKHHTYVANGIITHNSIHRWAGAAEDRLYGLDCDREVLPLSHRLPLEIFNLSQQVVRRIGRRFAKDQGALRAGGRVEWVSGADEVDMSSGTWLLLARTRSQLESHVRLAREQGVVYRLKGDSSVKAEHVRAVLAYENLRAGRRVEGHMVADALRAAGVRKGVDEGSSYTADELGFDVRPIWHDALVRVPLEDREYYLTCLRRGEKLTEPPRVRIETIHGAKGLESESTLLLTDMTYRTHRGYELDPDSEMRVLYVGLTRASDNLVLVAPQSAYGYSF